MPAEFDRTATATATAVAVAPAAADAVSRAERLVALVCRPVGAFARFTAVTANEVPSPERELLDHTSHMTVVMERYHSRELELRVVARITDRPGSDEWYAREIMLVDRSGRPVQHGIVRIDLAQVDADTARRIRAATEPLGHVLIDAGLLRDVRGVALLRLEAGPRLAALVGIDDTPAPVLYGRVADIALSGNAAPAVELLETVVPSARRSGDLH